MKLLDHLIEDYGFKNDRQIALNIVISIGTISKIRNGKLKAFCFNHYQDT